VLTTPNLKTGSAGLADHEPGTAAFDIRRLVATRIGRLLPPGVSGTVGLMLLSPRYEGPPILSIAGEPDDQVAPVVRQRRRLEAMLVNLSEHDWVSASRCAGWTVQDVVAHIVGVNRFWHASLLAGLAGAPTRILAGFDPATTPPLLVAPMRALTPRELLDQFVSSNDAFLAIVAELDNSGWALLAESPAGHVPIRLLACHALWDCWVHERDIALPLGLNPATEPDEVGSCLRYAAALSPALSIGSGQTFADVFAVEASDPDVCFVLDVTDSVAVHDGTTPRDAPCLRGDAVTLVESLSIRRPLPSSAPPEWVKLLGGLADVFDAEMPLVE
jgi:uncharacterized protein (TIGR03083 family)